MPREINRTILTYSADHVLNLSCLPSTQPRPPSTLAPPHQRSLPIQLRTELSTYFPDPTGLCGAARADYSAQRSHLRHLDSPQQHHPPLCCLPHHEPPGLSD